MEATAGSAACSLGFGDCRFTSNTKIFSSRYWSRIFYRIGAFVQSGNGVPASVVTPSSNPVTYSSLSRSVWPSMPRMNSGRNTLMAGTF